MSVVAKWLDGSRCHFIWKKDSPQANFGWMGSQLLSPRRGGAPAQFSAHVHCGQTTAWIKMALGIEVVLGSGYIVLDWDPAPLPKKGGGAPSPIFGPFLLWPNGWMHQDATRYGGRPQLR